jgi:hypothetical protein
MCVRYGNTIEDMVALSQFQAATSPTLIAARRRATWLVVGVVVLVALITDVSRGSVFFSLAALIFSLFFTALYPRAYRKSVDRTTRSLYGEGRNAAVLGEHVLETTPEGLVHRSDMAESRVAWEVVERVARTPTHGFVFTQASAAYVIPEASLEEGDLPTFLDEVVAHAGVPLEAHDGLQAGERRGSAWKSPLLWLAVAVLCVVGVLVSDRVLFGPHGVACGTHRVSVQGRLVNAATGDPIPDAYVMSLADRAWAFDGETIQRWRRPWNAQERRFEEDDFGESLREFGSLTPSAVSEPDGRFRLMLSVPCSSSRVLFGWRHSGNEPREGAEILLVEVPGREGVLVDVPQGTWARLATYQGPTDVYAVWDWGDVRVPLPPAVAAPADPD